MRSASFALFFAVPLTLAVACGGGGLVPSDTGPLPTGGTTGSGGAAPGSGGGLPASGGLGGGGAVEGSGGDAPGTGGDVSGTGGDVAGTGGGSPGCAPRVHLLLQRSGAMFDYPAVEDNWWDAVGNAMDGDGGLLGEFGDQIDLSVSIFTKVQDEGSCPLATSVPAPVGDGGLTDVMQAEEDDFNALRDPPVPEDAKKIDAPVPEAVDAAVTVLSGVEDAYILLAISGTPDSCEANDNPCIAEEVFTAVQAAHAAGIETRLIYLSSTDTALYPEGVANAGAGLGIENINICTPGFEYSDTPGDAPFEAPADTASVEQSLRDLLTDIAACN